MAMPHQTVLRTAAVSVVSMLVALALLPSTTALGQNQTDPLENDDAASAPARYPSIMNQFRYLPFCFPDTVDDATLTNILENFQAQNPVRHAAIIAGLDRFFTDSLVWQGNGLTGPSGLANPASLTYSFPPDGTQWGLTLGLPNDPGPNTLAAGLATVPSLALTDLGREYIRQALAGWRRVSGLTYSEVADDGAVMSTSTLHTAARGDVRIGGLPMTTASGVLAYNAFPGPNGIGGGDMVINTSFFATSFANSNNSFRLFRNVVAHEHGHGLSNIHTTPCSQTKLMEPFISVAFDMQQVDDKRAAARNYGDRFATNTSFAAAHAFGSLTTPTLHSIIVRDLSTNRLFSASNPTGNDWFTFTLDSAQTMTITVTPTGGTYQNGQQTTQCNPTNPPSINASQAGDLTVELYDSTGTSLLASAAAGGPGVTEILSAGSLAAGTYAVRVLDIGPNVAANQLVQLYDLEIDASGAPAPPDPIAGIDKRVQAGLTAFFLGNINSKALEPGASLLNSSYDWDLDGDGTFEKIGLPRPNQTYVSNGVYPVTLRLTDSNGQSASDTINVTVFGATTSLVSVSPPTGGAGATIPITIVGTNLRNVASAGEFTVSGTGATIIGTPTPNALGTQVTGLSLQIAAGAAASARDISISNSDGSATGVGVFTVINPQPGAFDLLSPADGASAADTVPMLDWSDSAGATSYNLTVMEDTNDDGTPDTTILSQTGLTASTFTPTLGTLNYKLDYTWSVDAVNASGTTASTQGSFVFRTPICNGDANYDKSVNFSDITTTLGNWLASFAAGRSGLGDSNNDGVVNFSDITTTLGAFNNTCP